MFTRAVYLLYLLHLLLGISENEFAVVSTTKRPSESLPTSELRQVTICTIDEKITHRLDSLESNNNGILHKLEILESKNHQNTIEKRLEEIEHRMEKIESNSEQIFQMLKAMNSTLLKLTSYHNNTVPNDHNETVLPKNCREVQRRGNNISQIYRIKPDLSSTDIEVLCDMERRGGGWTYILKRFDGSQKFNLNWKDFKIGFGKLRGEFWLGLENIHHMTESDDNELLVELVDWDNKEVYAHYDRFLIGSESEGYSLKLLGTYEGTAGDSLIYSVNMKFTTKDKDQDEDGSGSCAQTYGGAWWYKNCMLSLLTGKYYKENIANVASGTGLYWINFHASSYSLKQARMMIRPKN